MQIKGKITVKRSKDKIWSHFWLEQTVKRKRGEEKRKRKKKKKQKKEEPRKVRNFVWNSMELVWNYDFVWKCYGY